MNFYAYPIIFDAMKSSLDNYISVNLYESIIYIYRKNNLIFVKDNEKEIIYTQRNFNWFSNKPIEKITIIKDKCGSHFIDIFNKNHFKAAILIQQAWKNFKR